MLYLLVALLCPLTMAVVMRLLMRPGRRLRNDRSHDDDGH